MKKTVLSLLAALSMSTLIFAEGDVAPISVTEAENSSVYIGLGLTYNRIYSIDHDWFDKTPPTQDEVGSLGIIVGYEYNPYIAVEGRILTSFIDEDYADLTAYSIFLKPQYPINEDFKVYGLLGFGNVNVEGTDGDSPAVPEVIGRTILDESSFQWGLGVSYAAMDGVDLFFDFIRFMDNGDINSRLYDYDPVTYYKLTVNGITFGINYKF